MLKKISLLRDRVADWENYPFFVPAIRHLDELTVRSRICFFTGENGSGKSTLLEAIAVVGYFEIVLGQNRRST